MRAQTIQCSAMPMGWKQLLTASRTSLAERLQRFDDPASMMAAQRPPFAPGDVLGAAGRVLAEASSVQGPEVVTMRWPLLRGALPAACAGIDVNAPGRVPTVVGLLALRVVCANAMGDEPAAWPAPVSAWPDELASRRLRPEPAFLLAAAWSALALGDVAASARLVPPDEAAVGDRPPRDPTTLLRLVRDRAPEAAPAQRWWSTFLDDFPVMLETGAADWRILQATGRVLHRCINPAEAAGAWISAAVQQLGA